MRKIDFFIVKSQTYNGNIALNQCKVSSSAMQSLILHLKPLAKLFQQTGTAHLIAPSGFKVTILAGIVGGSTSWIYKRRARQLKPLLPAQRHKGHWRRWLATS